MKARALAFGLCALLACVACAEPASPDETREDIVSNRLINETSPYLLQHAHNPVDWYAWGPEAFAAARERGVPIFLSIGYSTCYWCHVMERESFEDPATAAVMNELFVCIKVDREERPEVDDAYMAATQMMTGGGGWPMSVFLEPEGLRPFWCGTYFPSEPKHGRPSFTQILHSLSGAWINQHAEVLMQAERLTEAVSEHLSAQTKPAGLGAEQVESATAALLTMYDRTQGGFGGAPKFPQPVYTVFLLDARDAVDEQTRDAIDLAVRFTLDRMAVGGLFDQVGGGFHRYCVDGTWTVPHFEKMLYDNAQLATLYARASVIYQDPFYARIARRTADYALREMTGDSGGFFSAQDAEVDHREGLNYLWTPQQVAAVLDDADAEFIGRVYGLDHGTNFQDPHHPEDGPKNVLRMADRPEKIAEKLGLTESDFLSRLDRINAALYSARQEREQPRLDDKVLAAWNGMMIAAMVECGETLGEPAYTDAAERAARFMLEHMISDHGLVRRSWRAGRAGDVGVLEDQAWAIVGLLALHNAGRGDGAFADAAERIAGAVDGVFQRDDGAYADVADGRADLFVRGRSTYDGATPSGAGVMVHALLGLHAARPDGPWLTRAVEQLATMSGEIAARPVAAVNGVRAVLRVLRDADAALLDFGPKPVQPAAEAGPASSARAVEIYADAETVTVREGEPAAFTLGIRIKPGFHLLAADPVLDGSGLEKSGGAEGLMPFRVGLASGQGVAVYADYPEGEPYGSEIVGADELLVYKGELRLSIVLERAEGIGAGPGVPVLGVTFQACDDSSCLEPVTVRLGVSVIVD